MPKQYPPLTPSQVVAILHACGFAKDRVCGSHHQYVGIVDGIHRTVTVDMAYKEFYCDIMKSMIRQSGLNRIEFYCATKETARKIGHTTK